MQERTQFIDDLLGRKELFGSRSLRDRHPADVLGGLLKEIYGIQNCQNLKEFLNGGRSPYTEAGSEEYKDRCDEELRRWLRSDLINVAAKSPQLKDTTFYPAALNLITGSKYYNGAGGDILYPALFATSIDSELNKKAKRIAYSINTLYGKHNIYRDITSILNFGIVKSAPMPSRQPELFPYFWCGYFATIRRDVDLLLRLQIPDPLLMVRFLIILLNFHLSQYVLRKCIANEELCKECVSESNTEDCRPIILLSFCNAISDKSQEQYRRHVQIIRSQLANNVERNVQKLAEKTAADSIDKILEVLAKERNGFAKKQQEGSRFIKKMKEAELHYQCFTS